MRVKKSKIQVNLSPDMGLAFDTGARLGAIRVVNGDGIDLGASGVEVDVTDIVDTAAGITESTVNNIGVNLTANKGLEFGTGTTAGSLQAKAGDGIKLSAAGIEANVTGSNGLVIGTGANDGELMVEVDSGLQITSGGVGVKLSDTSLTASGAGMAITPGAINMDIIGGGNPGNFTLTGAANGDELIGVTFFDKGSVNLTSVQDLTSQFSIPADNILNQTLGGATNTSAGYMQVFWMDRTD